ncbi:gas vesicle protein K [Dolichospermum compactum]|uniref:Gas vesicle protein GvpK n=1 Tax=Dolichospermum compactum NIES-806 TaxID=1973481 RepID=A0A1Z4V610_9CYAN|nr:gas vesicle protein K [Dolichospermum compactum]BAZ86937.1 gas vesicle protein GvpK [Dolichospermum compactum NIES-806]
MVYTPVESSNDFLSVTPVENSSEFLNTSPKKKSNNETGLAPLLLTVLELIRQLMEAQIIRRMEEDLLSESDLERTAESLQKLEEQILNLCQIFDIDPADLNINLGEFGTLLPASGSYYPGETGSRPSILELLDRLLNTGIVVDGEIDIGVAQLDLIHAKLRLVLTSKPI